MVLTMRLSGYNTSRIGTDPLNGQGIYTAIGTLPASWTITAGMASASTLSVTWDVRQFAAQTMSAAWDLYQIAAQSMAALWDVRKFAAQSLSALWDVGSGVLATISARWNVPFSKRAGTALSSGFLANAMTRHSATTTITEP